TGSVVENIASLTACGSTMLVPAAAPHGTFSLTRKPGRTLIFVATFVPVARSSLPPVRPTSPIAKPPPGSGPTGALNVALIRTTDPGPKATGVDHMLSEGMSSGDRPRGR